VIAGTHLAFASALYLGGAALFEYPPDPVSWGLAGAASLLPDLDLPTSWLGRALFWASTRLERRFGHRTVTHSALALAAVALLASPLLLLKPLGFWSVVGGYWSHLWADMLNLRGTDLLWPSPVRVVMPARQRHRLEVGGKGERVLLSALVVACAALYPVSGLGFRVGLMWLIADFDMAREEYVKRAGTRWYTLELKATDPLTRERVECQCPVLGVWREGLIVLHAGRPRAVGKSQAHHNLYPLSARLVEGPPLRVLPHRVDMRGHSLREKRSFPPAACGGGE
jgi:inner membrane protein